jgi:hypothetical protein
MRILLLIPCLVLAAVPTASFAQRTEPTQPTSPQQPTSSSQQPTSNVGGIDPSRIDRGAIVPDQQSDQRTPSGTDKSLQK